MTEKKIKNNMLSSCLTRRFRNKDIHSTGFPVKRGMTKDLESGRSMVEMLGVLAVVGVLSVGSIAGYTYAMNKYYANELLAGASERAVLVTAQIASGRKPSLKEFANHTTAGGTFATDDESIRVYTDGIGIPVSDVKGAVCKNLIKATDGTDILITDIDENEISADDCAEESNDLLFVFETGIGGSETGMETSECDPACEEGKECIGGVCAEVSGQCSNNGDCDEWCDENGGGEKCYCAISATSTGNDSACYNNFSGTCAKATIKSNSGGYLSTEIQMNWWSAVNFCKAHNASLPSLADLGITGGYQDDARCQGNECTGTIDWLNLQKYLTGYFWVTDASVCPMGEICTCNSDDPCIAGSNNNSCHVFNVLVEPRVVIGNYGRDEDTRTVCVDAF